MSCCAVAACADPACDLCVRVVPLVAAQLAAYDRARARRLLAVQAPTEHAGKFAEATKKASFLEKRTGRSKRVGPHR